MTPIFKVIRKRIAEHRAVQYWPGCVAEFTAHIPYRQQDERRILFVKAKKYFWHHLS